MRSGRAPLRASATAWQLSFGTVAWGRGEELRGWTPEPAQLGRCGEDGAVGLRGGCIPRLERAGSGLTEWFTNSPEGLKQGWTVQVSPPGRGPLQLLVGLEGLSANVDDGGAGASLHGAGVRLRYAGLAAKDADGRNLPIWLEAATGGVSVWVDDTAARYPLEIDPLLSSEDVILEMDQAGSRFGYSVDGAEDVNGDGFADVIVGARFWDDGEANEGGAFLFLGSASGLASTPAWSFSPDLTESRAGEAVAGAGDVDGDGYDDLLVGAPQWGGAPNYAGGAWLFLGSPTGPGAAADWSVESSQAAASFGGAVAGAGDLNGDGYGDVAVGAPGHDGDEANEGAVYVWYGSASGLSTVWPAPLEVDACGAAFGGAVAGAGDVNGDGFAELGVGAIGYADGEPGEGAAFLYLVAPAGVASSPDWSYESDQVHAGLGSAVDGAGDGDGDGDGYADVLVGATGWDDSSAVDGGGAFLFVGGAGGLATSPAWTGEPGLADGSCGSAVTGVGDVNGDGFADVVVGSYMLSSGESYEGRVWPYLGSADGLSSAADWTAESDQQFGELGISVAAAGDIDGDGFADLVAGAEGYANPDGGEDGAFVYMGSGAGLAAVAELSWQPDQSNADLGFAVANAGDVDGDGYDDLLLGAPRFDNGENKRVPGGAGPGLPGLRRGPGGHRRLELRVRRRRRPTRAGGRERRRSRRRRLRRRGRSDRGLGQRPRRRGGRLGLPGLGHRSGRRAHVERERRPGQRPLRQGDRRRGLRRRRLLRPRDRRLQLL